MDDLLQYSPALAVGGPTLIVAVTFVLKVARWFIASRAPKTEIPVDPSRPPVLLLIIDSAAVDKTIHDIIAMVERGGGQITQVGVASSPTLSTDS